MHACMYVELARSSEFTVNCAHAYVHTHTHTHTHTHMCAYTYSPLLCAREEAGLLSLVHTRAFVQRT